MTVIRVMAEMSSVSMGASASMSKVRQAAAVTPGGQAIGAGGTALLAGPGAGRGGCGWGGGRRAGAVRRGSRRLQRCRCRENTDHRRSEPSDPGANLPLRLILRYEERTMPYSR